MPTVVATGAGFSGTLLAAQGVEGVELGGFAGGIKAEEHPDDRAEG